MSIARATLAVLLWVSCAPGWAAPEVNAERLLTDEEVAGLERENSLWRLVRPADDEAINLARIKSAGFTAEEVAAAQRRLAELWEVTYERNFGWLREDAVERIQEIDRQFTTRMRAARLFAVTGIRAAGQTPGSERSIERLWRGAILRALDYDQIAEFRLMNSESAREVGRRVEGLTLSADELRTLFEWQREFGGRHAGVTMNGNTPGWIRAEQLAHWRRIRDLLGDERFVVYLSRENPSFMRMHEVLTQGGPISPTVALDLWWLRRKEGAERDAITKVDRRDEFTRRMRTRASELMGEVQFATYERDSDARWLVIPARPTRHRPADTSRRTPPSGYFEVPESKTGTP
jgi:hypothetical protein